MADGRSLAPVSTSDKRAENGVEGLLGRGCGFEARLISFASSERNSRGANVVRALRSTFTLYRAPFLSQTHSDAIHNHTWQHRERLPALATARRLRGRVSDSPRGSFAGHVVVGLGGRRTRYGHRPLRQSLCGTWPDVRVGSSVRHPRHYLACCLREHGRLISHAWGS
jgi:hypothetical protein